MATATQIFDEFNTPRGAFNRWIEGGYLKTPLEETTQGVARRFTKSNALEIALMTALTDAGLRYHAAQLVTADLVSRIEAGERIYIWIGAPERIDPQHRGRAVCAEIADAEGLDGFLMKYVDVHGRLRPVAIVPVANVVARVKRLFPDD